MIATNDNQLLIPEPEPDAAGTFHRMADQASVLETAVHGLVGKIDDTPDPVETLGVTRSGFRGYARTCAR
jgi:hypothetical protein